MARGCWKVYLSIMSLLDTSNGEGGEELRVGDLGVPLCHNAAQGGDGPVPGTWGISGPGKVWFGIGSDPTFHGDTSTHISCNLPVTERLNHNWRMLNPKWQRYRASLQNIPPLTPESDTARVISCRVWEDARVSAHIIRHNLSADSPGRSPGIDTLTLSFDYRIKSNSKYYWQVLSFFLPTEMHSECVFRILLMCIS